MKLVFFLSLSLFYEFAVHGDDQPQNKEIDTNELDECDQELIANLTYVPLRCKMKRAFWEKVKENDVIRKENDKLVKLLEDRDYRLNNSMYNFVNCAMTQIKALLEIVYRKTAKETSVPPSNEAAYEFCKHVRSFGYENADLFALIEREANWTEQYYNRSRPNITKTHKEVYVEEVIRYKNGWLKYLYTEEGCKLIKLIGPESITIENRCSLCLRFSINMARLFKIACVTCRNLLEILRKRSMQEPKKTFMSHLRDLVPQWSCTGEQIYFYNKLLKFTFPEYPDSSSLIAFKFGTINITESRNVTFFLPYTTENCGLQGSEEPQYFDTY